MRARLVGQDNPGGTSECDAEIARLRNALEETRASRDSWFEKAKEQAAEIARLRAEVGARVNDIKLLTAPIEVGGGREAYLRARIAELEGAEQNTLQAMAIAADGARLDERKRAAEVIREAIRLIEREARAASRQQDTFEARADRDARTLGRVKKLLRSIEPSAG